VRGTQCRRRSGGRRVGVPASCRGRYAAPAIPCHPRRQPPSICRTARRRERAWTPNCARNRGTRHRAWSEAAWSTFSFEGWRSAETAASSSVIKRSYVFLIQSQGLAPRLPFQTIVHWKCSNFLATNVRALASICRRQTCSPGPGMARTIGSHGPKTMEAIRKAGLRLIFEHGYEAMSLRQLASEVGIQVGSLYNHISTKQELLFDLVQDHLNELLRQLDLALKGKNQPIEKLRAFVAFHVLYHMTRKREVFIANSELRSLDPKNYVAIVTLRGAYERRLTGILAEGISEGVFEVADVQVATFAILALLTGVCTWYRPGGRLTREAIVATHEKLVLSGIAARGEIGASRGKRKMLRPLEAG